MTAEDAVAAAGELVGVRKTPRGRLRVYSQRCNVRSTWFLDRVVQFE